jgi:glycosyltransferase involved in cell wall biosynthesis
MRIGIDASCWINGRGYGRYTRELVSAMIARAPSDTFVCVADADAIDSFELRAPNLVLRQVDLTRAQTSAASADGNRSVTDMLRMTRAVARERLDVLFFPSVYTYFPVPPRLRAVVTVHDVIAERFPQLTLPTFRARICWRAKVRLALAQARLVLTSSEFSAREIASVLRVSPRRLRVAPAAPAGIYKPSACAADIAAGAAAVGLPPGARWFLYVGGFNPHKNVDALVDAHAAVVRESADPPYLLLVGRTEGDVFHSGIERIRAAITAAGTSHLVKWTGFLDDGGIRQLHSGTIALLLPSSAEGFGLTAVEAAMCGAPVIATKASPLPDLLEGGGFFVEPGDRAAIASAMSTLLRDSRLRRAMGERARERAALLTWQRSAEDALTVLREAAA